jgi:hypothetical protein
MYINICVKFHVFSFIGFIVYGLRPNPTDIFLHCHVFVLLHSTNLSEQMLHIFSKVY